MESSSSRPKPEEVRRSFIQHLLDFFNREKRSGALGGGVFGGFLVDPQKANDVDVVIIKNGVRKGGNTYRDGDIHVTELSPDVMRDRNSTFGHQAVESSRWIFGTKPKADAKKKK